MKQQTNDKEAIDGLRAAGFTEFTISRLIQLRRGYMTNKLDQTSLRSTDVKEAPSVSPSEKIPIFKMVIAGLGLKRLLR